MNDLRIKLRDQPNKLLSKIALKEFCKFCFLAKDEMSVFCIPQALWKDREIFLL